METGYLKKWVGESLPGLSLFTQAPMPNSRKLWQMCLSFAIEPQQSRPEALRGRSTFGAMGPRDELSGKVTKPRRHLRNGSFFPVVDMGITHGDRERSDFASPRD